MATSEGTLVLTGTLYDRLKFTVQVFLPGVGALYFGLAQIWALPEAERIVGTITVLSVFLGLILRASSKAYENSGARYSGDMVVDYDEENEPSTLRMELNDEPLNLIKGKAIVFRVKDGKHSAPN